MSLIEACLRPARTKPEMFRAIPPYRKLRHYPLWQNIRSEKHVMTSSLYAQFPIHQ